MKKNLFLSGFRQGMKMFGSNLALIINSFLLLIVYLVGVGLTSLVARVFKKHFLDKKPSKETKTYWSELNLKKKPIEEYYRQF